MLVRKIVFGAALIFLPTVLLVGGCSHCKAQFAQAAPQAAPVVTPVAELLPPKAKPGECYVKVFIPEQFETAKETVCVREASERLEIVPAKYDWVEERVVVKDASSILEEVPAEFEWQEQTVMTEPGHEGWHTGKTADYAHGQQLMSPDMYCFVKHEPKYETIRTQVLAKPAATREVVIPAEYQTVRRHKLVSPATTRRIPVPAEYRTVEKTWKVADSRVEWQRMDCKAEGRPGDAAVIVVKDSMER